ncbi:MAG: hypothetical protein K6G64_04555 [Eubacterium sp.]|nr:hypothetical protein [Eubacterium sp.]
MRRTDLTRKVFEDAKRFVPDYPKYKFKGKFLTPGDEPLIALSMAVNQCHPEPFRTEAIFCYWENVEGMKIDITEGKAFIGDGDISTRLLHWGTRFTKEYEYQRQVELLDIMQSNQDKKDIIIRKCVKKYNRKIRNKKIIDFIKRVINKIRRTLKLG